MGSTLAAAVCSRRFRGKGDEGTGIAGWACAGRTGSRNRGRADGQGGLRAGCACVAGGRAGERAGGRCSAWCIAVPWLHGSMAGQPIHKIPDSHHSRGESEHAVVAFILDEMYVSEPRPARSPPASTARPANGRNGQPPHARPRAVDDPNLTHLKSTFNISGNSCRVGHQHSTSIQLQSWKTTFLHFLITL